MLSPYKKSDFYRHARHVHAWLSSFAFLVLIFFAITGLTLNHPEWFNSDTAKQTDSHFELTESQRLNFQKMENPSSDLLAMLRTQSNDLKGRFKSSERIDDELMIRLEGATGSSDIEVDLVTGQGQITVSTATKISLLNDLHRGKNAGVAWKLLIDISAIIILVLSLAGYILYFSLKKRLSTNLWLTGVSVAVVAIAFILGV